MMFEHVCDVREWLSQTKKYDAPSGTRRNKLLTCRRFRQVFTTEPYGTIITTRNNLSPLARLRCWLASIRIEISCYKGSLVPVENRNCFHCIHNVEDGFHVLIR